MHFLHELFHLHRAKRYLLHTRAMERKKKINMILLKICRYLNLVKNCSIVL